MVRHLPFGEAERPKYVFVMVLRPKQIDWGSAGRARTSEPGDQVVR